MLEAAKNQKTMEDEDLARSERIRNLEARVEEAHRKDLLERDAAIKAAVQLNERLGRKTTRLSPQKINGRLNGVSHVNGSGHTNGVNGVDEPNSQCPSGACPHENRALSRNTAPPLKLKLDDGDGRVAV